ncbi:hypothetical protein Enr13x_59270 [Stieleria neptunia]|uniref:Uncharacterized protein n=1 Tax=Stieleria neptunia TaxID=2527979 RepID=A0A518HJH6_9BACT|nr:hypothetical protein [Stieleria neptunia]QDV40567.1 hypothetical protein Enr13x_03730 [Stieleria neptunia]QDV41004.1 hypothetical protein Enr13x_08420 [Stieleria neptunia]QDV41059.1 hypothetical protein Enr13x_08970 [Stieleria neptunia]QDV41955.1 hypothetical protein Enr13x_17980 [Stieleria neptunia]QDV43339.1 hypothetical protein Enr13x_31940 [Stieleria neptunia]
MSQATIEYKSPVSKLLGSARRGREKWKNNAMQSKRLIKELKQNLCNARESRQRWRGEASQLRRRVAELQSELEQLKTRSSP